MMHSPSEHIREEDIHRVCLLTIMMTLEQTSIMRKDEHVTFIVTLWRFVVRISSRVKTFLIMLILNNIYSVPLLKSGNYIYN